MSSRSPILERIITGVLIVVAGSVGLWALRPASVTAAPKISQPRIVVAVSGEVARPGVYELPFGSRAFAAIKAAGGFSARAEADLVNPAKRLEDGDQLRVPSRLPELIPLEPASTEPAVAIAAVSLKMDTKTPEKPGGKSPAKPSSKPGTPSSTGSSKPASSGTLLFALPKPPPPVIALRVSGATPSAPSSSATAKPTSGTASSTGWGFSMNTPASSAPARSAPEPDPAAILARGVNVNTASQAELEALPGIGPALAARIVESRPYSSTADLDRVKGIGPKMLEKLSPYLRF